MADVLISDLTTGVPNGSNFIPYTTSSVTNKTLVSSITAACQPVNYIGASVTKSTQTGIIANTITDCDFQSTPIFDSSGFYNNAVSNSRLTVPAGLGGIYLVTGYLTISATNAYTKNSIFLVKNTSVSVPIARNDTSIGLNGVDVSMTISAIVSLVASDYIRLRGFCENFNSTNTFKTPTLSMIRLGV
jgi:hypothetical protein